MAPISSAGPRKTIQKLNCPVAAPSGRGWYCSQAERPHSPAAREGSEKNPERRTDVSQTTDGEKSYTEDEDSANMWQPTSERLQVWRVNACRETDAHFPSDPARKNSPNGVLERRTGGFWLQLQMFCQCFLKKKKNLTCSVIGDKSVNHATHTRLSLPRLAISIPQTLPQIQHWTSGLNLNQGKPK